VGSPLSNIAPDDKRDQEWGKPMLRGFGLFHAIHCKWVRSVCLILHVKCLIDKQTQTKFVVRLSIS
jgi:hypothetical protein